MDEDPFDVRCGGRPGMEGGIAPLAELGPAIGVMDIDDNVGGIEQDDEALRQIGEGVDAEIRIAEEHGAGLRDSKGSADDSEIDVGQLLRRLDLADIANAGDLRNE